MTISSEIEYFFIFEATLGLDNRSNMAIDDVLLELGEACPLTPIEAQPYTNFLVADCDFDKDNCAWKSSDEGKLIETYQWH